ncbi:MAG: HEAT repeat domain-containing protein, partial [Candidatus Omnitrophica bacterium]|nr:HEAT repeat domain-containing protein [Candidatus Omnitrophota bacterium]
VCRFVLSEDGSGFSSKEMPELVKTTHVSFRPVDVAMGPDGALYIADFYNPIIQHGEVDFRDPRRDHEHGRIWRVTRKGQKPLAKPEIVGAPIPDLLEMLRAEEQWTRLHAKLELRERNPEEVLPVLEHWIGSLDPSDPQYDHLRLEGLWTLQNIRKTDPKLLENLLESKNPHVRAAAVRVVPQWRKDLSDPVNLLAKRVRDDNPRVRLEAVRALSQFPSAQPADLALNALDFEVDGFLDHALWLTVDELTDQWFPRVQAGEDVFRGNTKKLLYALEVVDQPTIVPPLIGVLSKKDLDDGSRKKALELVAKFGNAENMRSILDRVLDKNTSDSDRANLLAALIDATESRGLIPSGDLSGLSNL